jgi:RNA polymerase sigma-70 factor (ECF subfamily)
VGQTEVAAPSDNLYSRDVEKGSIGGGVPSSSSSSSGPPVVACAAAPPSRPPSSRVDRAGEEAALACVRRGGRDEALKILMTIYGAPLTTFALRILRDRELAKDVRQQVFLDAFQRIDTFEGRSSLWSWLCGITYHRCVDELRRAKRAEMVDHLDVLNELGGSSELVMDEDRVAKQRALEQCLGKLSVPLRTQLLMRYYLGLSYPEIAEVIGDPHGTVQVRISRILPRLRRCLIDEGVLR